MHIDDVERHECTVNSSKLAGHARALQRSKHQLPLPHRKNPKCVHTVWGKEENPPFTWWAGFNFRSLLCGLGEDIPKKGSNRMS